ncbi:manganese efflux pump MntP family protein [Psychrobium sp. 1_MG-2023]|uniref:manganese efflux pump MntP n=1 Tax=Psychrobium sp. 1_MG-2023 TaxID=3062624 RepID=UPI000C3376A3|nr:manganese efflux pump MntP family protein [Psychrobium sp. 1_MG-2023]MDP2561693.1 manganese efflux pump MntP family protein [Psychrobium sp. 1_MG-2023]PKF57096.1 manganese efflux pump MntP [Alteromonadales bacterium alter-6D02]
MFELILLALAVSMDAFAVSIGLGARKVTKPLSLAAKAAIYFGLFQGAMPVIGYFSGQGVLDWIKGYTHWVAFALLLIIGLKMIYESFDAGVEQSLSNISHRVLLVLAIATSIDAMAAGFVLHLIPVDPMLACGLIAVVTGLFSYLGVIIGTKTGDKLESKAELLGGIVLVLIGFKMLLF